MARCPFAIWHPLSGPSGSFTGGPFKIVHHTTEGSTALGAMAALGSKHADSHFVVDAADIYQLIDTSMGARSLRNKPGGVQTNLDSAIQIEVVGFAGKPKNPKTLENVRRLCRWIEEEHDIPPVWPNGHPKSATAMGGDPGGHNRDSRNWDTKGGHYGHSQVPENTHWDPAYTEAEVDYLMDATVPPMAISVRVLGITPEKLNLRSEPSAASLDKGDLPEGTLLEKIGEDGLWSKVRTPAGFEGWVASRFIEIV